MPRQTEPSVNNAMERVLQGMLSRSHVRSENTQTIAGHPGLRPDILIEDPGRAPVVIEAEYMPGASKKDEAESLTVLVFGALQRRSIHYGGAHLRRLPRLRATARFSSRKPIPTAPSSTAASSATS